MNQIVSPPLAPDGFDFDVYVVLDDFGSLGRSYRETDETHADRETMIRTLMAGEYENPVRIVCFSTARGTSKDVTAEIAREVKIRADQTGDELTPGLVDFIDSEVGRAARQRA